MTPSSLAIRRSGALPPAGPLPTIAQTVLCRFFPYHYIAECHRRLGDPFTIYPLDMPPLVFFADPDDIRTVTTASPATLHPGTGGNMLAPLVGQRSFMLLEEDEHLRARRTISPAFNHTLVSQHSQMLADIVTSEVASWPLETAVPLIPRIRALTLRVILRVIFGWDAPSLDRLHETLTAMLSVSSGPLLQLPRLRRMPGWHSTWQRFLKQRAEVDHLLHGLIECKRDESRTEDATLLGMLLTDANSDGSPASERQIRDDLMSMITAGHETTTGELAWAFQLLAHNQSAQSRLAKEIDTGSGEEYLTATVNETMRHKPVFLFTIPRAVVKPIEVGARIYHPPAHLAGCTYLLHHNPDLYEQPHEFRPERFIDEIPTARNWLPWGGGRKHCVGRHFAMLEIKSVLQEVLASRSVLPASSNVENPRWRSAILVPGAGGRVILRKRRRQASDTVRQNTRRETAMSRGGAAPKDRLDDLQPVWRTLLERASS